MPHKLTNGRPLDTDSGVLSIINSLSYLSREAMSAGYTDLHLMIQAMIDVFPHLKDQDAADKNSELRKVIDFIVQFKSASPDVQKRFLMLASLDEDDVKVV
jgi:hypothetical protein